MSIIKSGAGTDQWSIGPVTKAAALTLYGQAGSPAAFGGLNTFSATDTFTPAATPNDLVTISGSQTKIIRVISFIIGTNNTAAGSQKFFLVKRNSVNNGGTFVQAKAVRHDTAGARATATVGYYSVDQTTQGNAVGTINIVFGASPVAVPTTWALIVSGVGSNALELLPTINDQLKPITLRGKDELLALNFNNAALVSGQVHQYKIIWIEE